MIRAGFAGAVLLALAACATGPQAPHMGNEPLTLSLATATPGGGFPVYGEAFANAVKAADPTITISPRNTRGSAENVPLLEQRKVDLGLVQGEAAYEALAGVNRAGPADMKVLWAMYSSPGLFVVRTNSPYRSIGELEGRAVAWGARGSGLVLLGGYVVDALGLDRDRSFRATYLERAGDGPAMLLDGRIEALWGGGTGWPGFIRMADSPGGARFIAPSAREIERILARHPFLKRVVVPAGTYKGIDADLPSVGSWSFVFARSDLPEATAYRLARALHRAEADLARQLHQAHESTARNTRQAADPAVLHPGVARYLGDAGL